MNDGSKSPVDYIFGELDQPQNAAHWEKSRLSGVHHYSQKTPVAPKPGEAVTLEVQTNIEQPFKQVEIWLTTDDWQTVQTQSFTKYQLIWDSVAWSYIQKWHVTLPPQQEGVMLRYKIGASLYGSESVVYADNQARIFDKANHFSIWYGKNCNPGWAKRALVYQVFIDRFAPGEGNDWQQVSDLKRPFGGTLRGIIGKLSYIKGMGFNAIWMTPVFESPSHHGYDISDYFTLNPRLGTLEDFKYLISEAHRLGLKLILDFVANHCSSQHPYFKDALKSQQSEYHQWFLWKDWPNYESFFNIGSMPKLNLSYGSPAREHLLDAARYWLEMGVDGYRLDYANGPEHDFWVDFRRVCLSINPEVWTFGELVLPADVQASYSDGLGGTLDFLLCQALRATFATEDWELTKFAGFINSHYDYFPTEHSLPSFIDNHDMDRFFTIAGDDLQRLKLALFILYILPGPPIIYYGTERPLSQKKLIHAGGGLGFDEARLEMNWKKDNLPLLKDYLQRLASLRERIDLDSKFLWQASLLGGEGELLTFKSQDERLFAIINRSKSEKTITLPVTRLSARYHNVLENTFHSPTNDALRLVIAPMSGTLLELK